MLDFLFTLFMYHFIFSINVDANIKAWLYYLIGSRVGYNVHSHWCTTMAYIHNVLLFQLLLSTMHCLFLVIAKQFSDAGSVFLIFCITSVNIFMSRKREFNFQFPSFIMIICSTYFYIG